MDEKFAAVELEVEKADRKLGLIFFKCCAATPDVEDYDGDIPDEASMEAAFYAFLAERPDYPVDFEHKEKLAGTIVAGWWFPQEHCGRVAFKPEDAKVVEAAENGDIIGSSYGALVTREPI